MDKAINIDNFYHDGRGPELQRVHWGLRGTQLQAIEYYNPDDVYDDVSLKHVRFHGFQAVQVTPEEVIDYGELGQRFNRDRPAAMYDLGKSLWLKSFNPHHLSACSHFQLLFYDELFDIICESVTCHNGAYTGDGT
jgi:hypothetical protein